MPSSKELRSFIRALEVIREVDPDITLPSILGFLYAGETDNQSGNQAATEVWLGMSNATASRAIAHWADFKRPRVAGLDMILSTPDPEDRRFKIVTLKRSGLELVEKIRDAINGQSTRD